MHWGARKNPSQSAENPGHLVSLSPEEGRTGGGDWGASECRSPERLGEQWGVRTPETGRGVRGEEEKQASGEGGNLAGGVRDRPTNKAQKQPHWVWGQGAIGDLAGAGPGRARGRTKMGTEV